MKKPVTAAAVPKAKVHRHVRPVRVTQAVKAKRHAAAVKASKTRAANAKKAKQHPRRGLALGEVLPVCAFEAVAMSLRLAGYDLSDDDVAGVWDLAGSPEQGVRIGDAVGIAAQYGIGGVRPGQFGCRPLRLLPGAHDGFLGLHPGDFPGEPRGESGIEVHGLILGVNVPGPHAVLATADGWWSWGGLYDPWTDEIDEAWEVTW